MGGGRGCLVLPKPIGSSTNECRHSLWRHRMVKSISEELWKVVVKTKRSIKVAGNVTQTSAPWKRIFCPLLFIWAETNSIPQRLHRPLADCWRRDEATQYRFKVDVSHSIFDIFCNNFEIPQALLTCCRRVRMCERSESQGKTRPPHRCLSWFNGILHPICQKLTRVQIRSSSRQLWEQMLTAACPK